MAVKNFQSSRFRLAYSVALRCVAQDLERRGLKSFDLRAYAEILRVEAGYQEPPSSTPVSIEYTVRDIEELDRAGEARRGEPSSKQDFMNPVQIFRTIGSYLDRNEACLVRLTNNHERQQESRFTMEYLTRDGERVVDERPAAAVYDMSVQMYKHRGRLTGTEGRREKWRR